MEQYINKASVMEEIEKLKGKVSDGSSYCNGWQHALRILELSLDTLEVEETVDAEIVEVEDNNNSMYAYTHLEIYTDEDLNKICKDGDKAKVIIIKQK